MSILHEILYVIPLLMVSVSAIVLFRVKTDDVEGAGIKVMLFMVVCAVSVFLFIAICAFKMLI